MLARSALINHLQQLAKQLGRTPSYDDIADADGPSVGPYYREFGSLVRAQQLAGLAPLTSQERRREYDEMDLLLYLYLLALAIGRRPALSDFDRFAGPTLGAYRRRFGTLYDACVRAGLDELDATRSTRRRRQSYSSTELLDHLRNLHQQLGRPLTLRDVNAAGPPTGATYLRRFRTFQAACQAAGILLEPPRRFEPSQLLAHLSTVVESIGRSPTGGDLARFGGPSYSTYRLHFGSMREALARIGRTPNPTGRPIREAITAHPEAVESIRLDRDD